MPKKQPGSVSRGDFFKKGAVVGAGATTLAGQAAQPRRGQVQFGSVADVVIVGAGASGLPAAIMARDQGASVIVTLGGSLTPYRD
jgi:NADPH-dependent 2,4-dienoyl-CoA reductase/sulfur reductase-like enzyme